jgi:U4/U6.U5 tri-snRNP-associated protein 2
LQWFLNTLHKDLGGTKKKNSSIIYQVFQGEVQVTTETPLKKGQDMKLEEFTEDTKTVPFLFLSLEIPPPPLFKDQQEKNIIPQVQMT